MAEDAIRSNALEIAGSSRPRHSFAASSACAVLHALAQVICRGDPDVIAVEVSVAACLEGSGSGGVGAAVSTGHVAVDDFAAGI